jgi:hypothetical protein
MEGDTHFAGFLKTFTSDGKEVRLPSKDNGFDIEGLVVQGDKIFLGLRGPVLRGWACILEIRIKDKEGKADFELAKFQGGFGESDKYRKHFVNLYGLGIRDLHADGDDLYLLSGPTMDLDGPAQITLWEKAFEKMGSNDSLTPRGASGLGQPMSLTVGMGDDHPEGIAVMSSPGNGAKKMVVVYDSPSSVRRKGDNDVDADLLSLPKQH